MTDQRPSPRPRPRPGPDLRPGSSQSSRPSPVPRPATTSGRVRTAWSQAQARVDEREAARRPARRPLPLSRLGARIGPFVTMVLIAAIPWVLYAVDRAARLHLTRYGLRPRSVLGLRGIVIGPFVDDTVAHLVSNTLPLLIIGYVVLLSGTRRWAIATAVIVVLGGLVTWVIGPSGALVVGAGGVVFGYLGYLITRALFGRRFTEIVAAIAILAFFATLFDGLLHSTAAAPWQAHVGGFVAGLVVGVALHRGDVARRRAQRAAVS